MLKLLCTIRVQCMEDAKARGLKSWVEENGLHPETRKMLDRKRAEGLDFVLKQPVLDDKEVHCRFVIPCLVCEFQCTCNFLSPDVQAYKASGCMVKRHWDFVCRTFGSSNSLKSFKSGVHFRIPARVAKCCWCATCWEPAMCVAVCTYWHCCVAALWNARQCCRPFNML